MTRWCRLLLATAIAALGWMVGPTAVAGELPDAPVATFGYDTPACCANSVHVALERGPPAQPRLDTTYDPDGLRPVGLAARLDGPMPPSIYGYDTRRGSCKPHTVATVPRRVLAALRRILLSPGDSVLPQTQECVHCLRSPRRCPVGQRTRTCTWAFGTGSRCMAGSRPISVGGRVSTVIASISFVR